MAMVKKEEEVVTNTCTGHSGHEKAVISTSPNVHRVDNNGRNSHLTKTEKTTAQVVVVGGSIIDFVVRSKERQLKVRQIISTRYSLVQGNWKLFLYSKRIIKVRF